MFSYSVIAEKSRLICCYLAIIIAIAAAISTAVTSVLCIVMLLAWCLSGHVWQDLKLSAKQPAGKMLLLFLAWLLISSLYADTPWPDRFATLLSWKKLFYTFILLGIFHQAQWKQRFVYCYVTAMSIAAVIVIAVWLLDIQVREQEVGIIMSNHSAQSLAFTAAALCGVFLFKQAQGLPNKILLTGVIGLFIFDIFFVSVSRSGYLALPVAVVLLVVGLYGYKKLPHILGVTLIAVLLATLMSTTVQQRVRLGWEESKNSQTTKVLTSIGIRDVFRENTVELIQKKPWLGYGTSSFTPIYSTHVAAKYQDWRGDAAADPHNQYLFVWLENGLVGLLLFLIYIYSAIKQGLNQASYGAVAAGLLAAFAATSLFSSHFKTFPEGYLLAFFVGCLLGRQSSNQQEQASA